MSDSPHSSDRFLRALDAASSLESSAACEDHGHSHDAHVFQDGLEALDATPLLLRCPSCQTGLHLQSRDIGVEGFCPICKVPIVATRTAEGKIMIRSLDAPQPPQLFFEARKRRTNGTANGHSHSSAKEHRFLLPMHETPIEEETSAKEQTQTANIVPFEGNPSTPGSTEAPQSLALSLDFFANPSRPEDSGQATSGFEFTWPRVAATALVAGAALALAVLIWNPFAEESEPLAPPVHPAPTPADLLPPSNATPTLPSPEAATTPGKPTSPEVSAALQPALSEPVIDANNPVAAPLAPPQSDLAFLAEACVRAFLGTPSPSDRLVHVLRPADSMRAVLDFTLAHPSAERLHFEHLGTEFHPEEQRWFSRFQLMHQETPLMPLIVCHQQDGASKIDFLLSCQQRDRCLDRFFAGPQLGEQLTVFAEVRGPVEEALETRAFSNLFDSPPLLVAIRPALAPGAETLIPVPADSPAFAALREALTSDNGIKTANVRLRWQAASKASHPPIAVLEAVESWSLWTPRTV